MKISKTIIQDLDLFAIPFQFSLAQNEKGKKTFIGGILSILIGVASLSYFIYLCYLYWNNKIAPSTSIIEQYSLKTFSLNIEPEAYAIQVILSDGVNLQTHQSQSNKILLHIIGMFSSVDDNGNLLFDQTLAQPCKSSELKGYYCFYFQQNPDGTKLTYRQTNNSQLSIIFSKCLNDQLTSTQQCETDTSIIQKELVSLDTAISIRFILKQYNSMIKEIVNRIAIEKFVFDDNLSFITFLNLKKSENTINDGFLFQKSEESTFISHYDRNNMVVGKNTMIQQLGFEAYGGLLFSLVPNYTEISITFPQFTYILAQFSSIFNSLLFIGFLSKIFAESEICHEMMALHLQVYYKFTALQLLAQKESKIDKIKDNKLGSHENIKQNMEEKIEDNSVQIIPSNNKNIKSLLEQKEEENKIIPLMENKDQKTKNVKLDEQTHDKSEKDQITKENHSSVSLFLSLYQKVKSLNFKTFFSEKMKISFLTRIFTVIFPTKKQSNKSKDYQIYSKLLSVSSNSLSAFEFQKEILTIKIMLRLLLSPDQYAAALLCGSKIQLKKEEEEVKVICQSSEKKEQSVCNEGSKQESHCLDTQQKDDSHLLNHLEKIDQIEEDEQQLEYYVYKFLSKLKTQQLLSDVDLRIRNSMIGSLPTNAIQNNKKLSPSKNLVKIFTLHK